MSEGDDGAGEGGNDAGRFSCFDNMLMCSAVYRLKSQATAAKVRAISEWSEHWHGSGTVDMAGCSASDCWCFTSVYTPNVNWACWVPRLLYALDILIPAISRNWCLNKFHPCHHIRSLRSLDHRSLERVLWKPHFLH